MLLVSVNARIAHLHDNQMTCSHYDMNLLPCVLCDLGRVCRGSGEREGREREGEGGRERERERGGGKEAERVGGRGRGKEDRREKGQRNKTTKCAYI